MSERGGRTDGTAGRERHDARTARRSAQRVAATGGAPGAVRFLLAGTGRRGRRLCQVRRLLPGKLPAAPAGRPGRAYPRGQLRPGYLVSLLREAGYTDVRGIDSDPEKIAHARRRQLSCETAHAFAFLEQSHEPFDVIVPEQELNHLTLDEQLEFLSLCLRNLKPGGLMIVYGLNGANPLVGSENLAHNIDHFNTFTDYSLNQILQLAGFTDIKVMPLKLYVFWKNPLNYAGLAATSLLELFFRVCFILYGKDVKVLTKKLAAVCVAPR